MAISRSLSNAGIAHHLIGRPPTGRRPALGESLNLEGTLGLARLFPDQAEHFVLKDAVVSHLGDQVVRCNLAFADSPLARVIYRILGEAAPSGFLHVDRPLFDKAAFAEVIAAPECSFHAGDAGDLRYDAARDRITRLSLPGGEALEPGVVFDATAAFGVVPRAMGQAAEPIGPPHRVAFAHYSGAGDAPWRHATHVLRMTDAEDGLDALAWMIPLGPRASVGITVRGAGPVDTDRLLEAARDGFARRGMDLRAAWPALEGAAGVPRLQHYRHARAFGANWLLAGTTYRQVWFGTAAGVSMGLLAADCAPAFLKDPRETGRRYQAVLDAFDRSHGVFEWLREVPPATADPAELHARATKLVEQSVFRLARQAALVRRGVARAGLDLLVAGLERSGFDFSGICTVTAAPSADHGATLYADPAQQAAWLAHLQRLLAVVAGQHPLDEAEALFWPDVVFHMDWLRTRGLRGWRDWVRRIQAEHGLEDHHYVIVDQQPIHEGLRVLVEARGLRDGVPVRSEAMPFAYRFRDGRIAEVWTSRANYRFYFGAASERPLGFAALQARITIAGRLAERRARRSAR